MTTHLSRDFFPTTNSLSNTYTQFMYELSVFMHRVLGYSVVGHTAWDITSLRNQVNVASGTNTAPISITTATPHGFVTGQNVYITGAGTGANGASAIVVTGANTFTLTSSSPNAAFGAGGTATTGLMYASGLASNSLGAGINFGAGVEKEVSIPSSVRVVSAGDVNKMLVLKSRRYPTKNSGCFKITSVNTVSNRYGIDYRSTENPPIELDNSMDWWLYENDGIASSFLSTFSYNSAINISAATNASPIVISTNTHNLSTGQVVEVYNVAGNTAANGIWTITSLSPTTMALNGSTGNGTFVGTGGPAVRISGYTGSGLIPTSRIILQSPHSSAWQVRIAVETSASRLPLITIATGYGGNSIGDFSIGGNHTHVYQFINSNPTSSLDNLTAGAGGISFTSRLTIIGDDLGQHVGGYTVTLGSTANGIFSFGIPNNEPSPLPANNAERLYSYGSVGNQFISGDYGGISFRVNSQGNIGNATKGVPELCALTGWCHIGGAGGNSPILNINAGDTPFLNATELLPVEVWAGTFASMSLNDTVSPPFAFDQRYLGSSPCFRQGRINFGNFSLTSEETTIRTVTAATNTSPIQITTSATNNLITGQTVVVAGVGGNTAANGTFTITVINGTNFTLDGSTGNGTYTSGGTATGTPGWLHLQNGIFLKWNGPSGITA